MTHAQRKEYPPSPATSTVIDAPDSLPSIVREPPEIVPEQNLIDLSAQKKQQQQSASCTPEPVAVRTSVIQRNPSAASSNASSPALASSSSSPSPPIDKEQTTSRRVLQTESQMFRHMHRPMASRLLVPEQEHPIDYHIPKKRDYLGPSKRRYDVGSEDEEDRKIKKIEQMDELMKKIRQANPTILRRVLLQKIKNLPQGSTAIPALLGFIGITQAAAGHGRSSSNNSGQQSNGNSGTTSNGSSGGSVNFSSGSAGCGNSGASGGLGGTGPGGNGRDNRSNYGPNSPPTGSLPPFYESLKGGAANGGLNAYNAQNGNNNSFNNYLLDCDPNGELTNIGGYPNSPQDASTKQYSVLQNAYLQNGMVMKDEIDLDYDGKMDSLSSLNGNLLQSYGDGYTDSMMADLSNAVDPLQLTATLTFSSPNEHALLESCLTDAVDLTQFLQRLPTEDDHCNDLELSPPSSLTPDGESHGQQNHQLGSFQDHLIGGGLVGMIVQNDRQMYYKSTSPPSSTSSYENPPPYQTSRELNGMIHQHNHQQQQHHGYDMDSHSSNISLPSPGAHYDSIHSPQQNHHMVHNAEMQPPSASTTPSPNTMATIQNVSKSLKSNRRLLTPSKLSNLLTVSATLLEPPIVSEVKGTVLRQRVSKF